jgi:hypothetical protein
MKDHRQMFRSIIPYVSCYCSGLQCGKSNLQPGSGVQGCSYGGRRGFSRCRRPTKQLHLRRLGISMSASLQMDGRLPWRNRGNPKLSPKKGIASNPLGSDNSSTPFFGQQRPKGPLKATQWLFRKIVDSRVGTTVGR